MRIKPRLQKIEAKLRQSGPIKRYTCEELAIAGYEFRLAILASGCFPERQADLAAHTSRTEAGIRSQAHKQAGERYRRHIDEWVTEMWLGSRHILPFVSPVIGSEYEDWDQPNLAARRLAVRLRPSIIALVGIPVAAITPDLVPAAPFDPIEVLKSLKTGS